MAEAAPKWGLVATGVGTLAAALAVFEGIISFQTQLDARFENKVDKAVFDTAIKALNDRIETLVATDDKSLGETLHQVHDLESRIVGRDENADHWKALDTLIARVNAIAEKQCRP